MATLIRDSIAGRGVARYLRRTVNFGDTGIGTADTVAIGRLPSGSEIVGCFVDIQTVFNAGTTNVLTIGTNAGSDNNIVNAGDVDETALGVSQVMRGVGLAITTDTPVFALYTQTGGAATTGKAVITIAYLPHIGG